MPRDNHVPSQGGQQSTASGKPSCHIGCSRTDHVSRQHVYRYHILPIKCPSCSQVFESSRMFTRHLHAESMCDRSLCEADEPIKGLEAILQKIQSPKSTAENPSEEDMWKVIYTTLFPDDPKDEIPSPCECTSGAPSPPRLPPLELGCIYVA